MSEQELNDLRASYGGSLDLFGYPGSSARQMAEIIKNCVAEIERLRAELDGEDDRYHERRRIGEEYND